MTEVCTQIQHPNNNNLPINDIILYPNSNTLRKCVKLIHYLYENNRKQHAFTLYINFIKKYALNVDLKRFQDWQIQDMRNAIEHDEYMWLRTRRGGKTRDLTLVAIFWCIVGKSVLWFAPAADQLKQANIYFMYNPFFVKNVKDYIFIIDCNTNIEVSNLTLSRSASKGKDCLIYDEGAKVEKGLKIYDYYKFSRVIIAAKLWEGDKHILYATTASRNSAAEEQHDSLVSKDTSLVSIHNYHACWWISDEWVESERLLNMNDNWFVDQEYLTLFVSRGGSVFENLQIMDINDMPNNIITHFGMDINKKDNIIGIHFDKKQSAIYVLYEHEHNWAQDPTCFDYIKPDRQFKNPKFPHINYQIHHDFMIEIESIGYNEKQALWMGNNLTNTYLNYDWTDTEKGERVAIAKLNTIYIDPNITPRIYQDLRNAIYHTYKPVYVKDSGHPCHWLDAFLHALNLRSGYIISLDKSEGRTLVPRHLQRKGLRFD